jgi:hypothetical protein
VGGHHPPEGRGSRQLTIRIGDGEDADVVPDDRVASEGTLLAAIERAPIAAATLALLLRGAERRTVEDGLVAESMAYSVLQAGPEFARWLASHRRGPARDGGEPIHVQRDGDVLTITLTRPHVRNALNVAMRDALLDAFEIAAVDEDVRVVLRGDGPSFCSGGDLDEFGTFPDPASAHLLRVRTSIGRVIAGIAPRITARVHGTCAGSGVELAAFAGTVVADRATTFVLPELSLGLIPGAGGTVSMTGRIGRRRVALLALSGATIDAATALEWGLVDRIE